MAAVKEVQFRKHLAVALVYAIAKKKKNKRRRWYVHPLNKTRRQDGEFALFVHHMRNTDEEMHFSYFRMCAARFDDLLKRVSPFIKHANTHRTPISTAERLALTLRVLACGATQQSVAETFKMGPSTARRIVTEMCEAIWVALKEEFVSVPKRAQWETIAQDFWSRWNFPNCIGAIGGKQVLLRAPSRCGSLHFKETHSVALLAVCDAQFKFTMVDIGAYSQENDGGVLQVSPFGEAFLQGQLDLAAPKALPGTTTVCPHVIIGDATFPLNMNLMRPYSGENLTTAQRVYNYRHCWAQQTIENAFSIMSSQFQIFGRPIESSAEKAVCIVQACVALHNYLISTDAASAEKAKYITPNLADDTTPAGDVRPGEWRGLTEPGSSLVPLGRPTHPRRTQADTATRKVLKDFFQTPEGSVPWQDRVITCGLNDAH
ncbi:uncharacterized protein LOC127450100 [Myxocyprinus asiaticus]|uniref:uncharacterized protein LOC127450100 n=1 Tax=Myxocyprinus asiaticus TaxID=70543 RepID=UPI002223A339|nr:uncharacterized protein LOC127450100 [Myxocyprinus asiaticus]